MDHRRVHTVACGGRNEAFNDFQVAVNDPKHVNTAVFLLVDSEVVVTAGMTATQHLRNHDRWDFPDGVSEDRVHLMVQCMEAWFMADKQTITEYYKRGFSPRSLPANPNIEAISKKDILNGLQQAARGTSKNGYSKGSDAFEILGLIRADLVFDASPHAARLRDCLRRATA